MLHPNRGCIVVQLSFFIVIQLQQFSHSVNGARLSGNEEQRHNIHLANLLKDDNLKIFNVEYVKETRDKIRMGCTIDLNSDKTKLDNSPQSSPHHSLNKRIKSLFIQDASGYKDVVKLSHATASFKNVSGLLEERKVFLREFPEECFKVLLGPRGMMCPPGPPGKVGTPGKVGNLGLPGRDGKSGTPGINGKDGPPGKDGPVGDPGQPGERGDMGDPGLQGVAGNPGANGLPGLDGEDAVPERKQ